MKEFLKSKISKIEKELDRYTKVKNNRQSEIYDAMRYSVMAGGKRLRPVIMLLSCEMCGGTDKDVMPFACALEMIHTYSLIHDDLPAMDNDDLRRGKPTNHVVYGEGMAILAGDALLNKAMEVAMSADVAPEIKVKAAAALFAASGTEGMIGGQVIDIKNSPMSAEELENLHLLKTGALIRAAGNVGAIVGRGNDAEIEAIDMYCKSLGIAFQIQDDILDVKGSEAELGKPIGSDKSNNKTTYVTLFGLEKAEELAEEYTKRAVESLRKCFGEKADKLTALAEYLMGRNL